MSGLGPGWRRASLCLVATGWSLAALAAREPQASSALADGVGVRRWEYVVLVRTETEFPSAVGRAEEAALRAGGAVLETVRTDAGPGTSDHRLLLRLRDKGLLGPVLRSMQQERGVIGATAVPLPETPTGPGGPSFMLAYTSELGDDNPDPRVIVHSDVPPVLDKRDLLEQVSVPVGPGDGRDPALSGGVGFNISELIKKLKYGSWLRREQRMKSAYLPILPPAGDGPSAP